MARAQVDEGLHCLVGVGGEVLSLGCFDDADGVVDPGGKVHDAVVYVGAFVDPHEGLVEDLEEVAEEAESVGLWEC